MAVMKKRKYYLRPVLHTSTYEALRKLKKIISFRSGIVKKVYEILPKMDEARAFYFSVEVTKTEGILGEKFPEVGGGGYKKEDAITAVLGECIERYCGIYIPKEKIIFGDSEQIGSMCVKPEEFALFSEQQYREKNFPYEPFEKKSKVGWIEGFSLPECEVVYLPTQLVYLGSSLKILTEEQPIGYTTSSGLACGSTLEEAILFALLELVERDAFMITWWNKLTLPLVDIDSLEPKIKDKISKTFDPTGLQYKVIDLSIFTGIPTFLGVVRNCSSEFVPMALGAASSLDSQRAILKALLEAYNTRSLMKKIYYEESNKKLKSTDEIKSFRDGLLWWCQKENVPNAEFLDSSSNKVGNIFSIKYKTVLDGILTIIKKLELQGIKCYAVDVTTPDIQQLGLYVVKVVCPKLCQLNAFHKLRFLGGKRLYNHAYEVGVANKIIKEEELNCFPHPFP